MRRWALLGGDFRSGRGAPGLLSGRLIVLFVVSVCFTLLLTTGPVTADRLFQSPESPASPPAEPIPVEQPPAEVQPVQVDPDASLTGQPAVEPAAPVPPTRAPRSSRDGDVPSGKEDEQGRRNFILDQIELIDTVIVSGAYVWVCCGIGALLLAPILLLVLEIRGRSKLGRRKDL